MHATRIFRVASVCHLFGHIPAVPCICHKILVRGTPLFNSWQYFWHFRRLLGRWPWWIAIGFFDWAIFRLGIWLGSWGKGIGVSTPQPFWHESTAVTEIPLYAKFPLVRAVESTRSPRWRSSLTKSNAPTAPAASAPRAPRPSSPHLQRSSPHTAPSGCDDRLRPVARPPHPRHFIRYVEVLQHPHDPHSVGPRRDHLHSSATSGAQQRVVRQRGSSSAVSACSRRRKPRGTSHIGCM